MDPDIYCRFLEWVVQALVSRLGGEVQLTHVEVWDAADRPAIWDRNEELLVIKLGPK